MTADADERGVSPPLRTCTGCGRTDAKSAFIRVARLPDGTVSIDKDRRTPGRGAYVCPREECVDSAKRKRSLSRALKCPVGDEIYMELKQVCNGGED